MKNSILFFFLLLNFACVDSEELEYEQYLVYGEVIYKEKCANCHGENGEGLRALFPPITENENLRNTDLVICIIKNGAAGGSEIKGINYKQSMPASSRMFDLDIAQLTTFVQNEFASKNEKITVRQVKKALANCD